MMECNLVCQTMQNNIPRTEEHSGSLKLLRIYLEQALDSQMHQQKQLHQT